MEYLVLKLAYCVCLVNYYIGMSPPPPDELIKYLEESKKNFKKKQASNMDNPISDIKKMFSAITTNKDKLSSLNIMFYPIY